jgi:hypothetical protein
MEQEMRNSTPDPTKKTMKLTNITLAAVAVMGISSARAQLVFTYENPGVQATTVSGVITETFDSLPLGSFSGSILGGAGSLSPGGAVVSGTASGGAYGGAGTGTPGSVTDFYAIGGQSGNAGPVTLTFTTPQRYFGMWWPAGDAQNRLSLYDPANNLLGNYSVASILSGLPSTYLGNPNNGLDTGEKFAYLDFTTIGSTTIGKVVFGNNGSTGTGFEMDNFSITDQQITPPGNSVPDGGATALLLGAALSGLGLIRRKLLS